MPELQTEMPLFSNNSCRSYEKIFRRSTNFVRKRDKKLTLLILSVSAILSCQSLLIVCINFSFSLISALSFSADFSAWRIESIWKIDEKRSFVRYFSIGQFFSQFIDFVSQFSNNRSGFVFVDHGMINDLFRLIGVSQRRNRFFIIIISWWNRCQHNRKRISTETVLKISNRWWKRRKSLIVAGFLLSKATLKRNLDKERRFSLLISNCFQLIDVLPMLKWLILMLKEI